MMLEMLAMCSHGHLLLNTQLKNPFFCWGKLLNHFVTKNQAGMWLFAFFRFDTDAAGTHEVRSEMNLDSTKCL